MTFNDNAKKGNKLIYPIFLPKSSDIQKFSILNFRESDNVDFTVGSSAKIKRENNLKDFKSAYDMDTAPKFGEGSQFGKEQKDEARRKKYGILSRKYNPSDQPWILNLGSGKEARKFKGSKCKDLMDNASYFAFVSDSDGTFTALPIDEWCDFKYVPKYKTLSIEEAEEEFSRRDKVHNQYAIMLNKRKKDEMDETDVNKTSGDKEGSNDEDSDEEVKKEKEKKKDKKTGGSKKKKEDEDEDEDGGEFDEGQELDYITDDSSNGEDKKEVDEEEEDGGESEDEEEENKEDETANNNTANNNNNKNSDSSDTSSDSDIDNDPHLPILVNKEGHGKRSHTDISSSVPSKKQKLDSSNTTPLPSIPPTTTKPIIPTSTKPIPPSTTATTTNAKSTDSSLEHQVRRYLLRKPMTSKDLIHKLRKTTCSKEQLMDDIVAVLLKINPSQTTVNDKLYFNLKPSANNDEEGDGKSHE